MSIIKIANEFILTDNTEEINNKIFMISTFQDRLLVILKKMIYLGGIKENQNHEYHTGRKFNREGNGRKTSIGKDIK